MISPPDIDRLEFQRQAIREPLSWDEQRAAWIVFQQLSSNPESCVCRSDAFLSEESRNAAGLAATISIPAESWATPTR